MNNEDRKRLAGLFRVWLGLAQMAAATIAALLLGGTGLSSATISAVLLTTALPVLSALVREGSRRCQAAMVASVSWNRRAVSAELQPAAAFTWRIAKRSQGG